MIKLVKKAAALVLVAVMTMTMFVGCGKEEVTLDPKEVVMVVGETEVTMNIANFYVRYNQSLMESLYLSYIGEDVWIQETTNGTTYEEQLKSDLLDQIKEMYIIATHAGDYDVTLTDDEVAAIESVADTFLKENESAESMDKVSADKDTIVEYLKVYTLTHKVSEAMREDVKQEVTDDEAAQKRVRYVVYDKVIENSDGTTKELSKKEIEAAKKDADAFLKGAKANGSMEAYGTEKEVATKTLTFSADSTSLDKEVIKAADALKEGEFSKVIETEDGFYVLQLESLFDAEATEAAKETVLNNRKEDRYEELLEKWTKDTKVTVNEDAWNKISIQGLQVNYQYDPEEEDKTTEE